MSTLAEIRAGIAANLGAIAGLQVSAYALSNPTPPCIEIVPSVIDYDMTMGGSDKYAVTVRVFVGTTSDIGAQKRLDLHLEPSGTSSIKAAIETDPTLGGTVDDVDIRTATGYRVYGDGGRLLGAEWEVIVIGSP